MCSITTNWVWRASSRYDFKLAPIAKQDFEELEMRGVERTQGPPLQDLVDALQCRSPAFVLATAWSPAFRLDRSIGFDDRPAQLVQCVGQC